MYTALAPRARRPAALAPRTRRPPALAPRACRPPLLCPPCLCRELAAARPVRAAQLRGFEEGGGEEINLTSTNTKETNFCFAFLILDKAGKTSKPKTCK